MLSSFPVDLASWELKLAGSSLQQQQRGVHQDEQVYSEGEDEEEEEKEEDEEEVGEPTASMATAEGRLYHSSSDNDSLLK